MTKTSVMKNNVDRTIMQSNMGRNMLNKFKLELMSVLFGRCPKCGDPGKQTEIRGLKYFLPPLHCPKCDIYYSSF